MEKAEGSLSCTYRENTEMQLHNVTTCMCNEILNAMWEGFIDYLGGGQVGTIDTSGTGMCVCAIWGGGGGGLGEYPLGLFLTQLWNKTYSACMMTHQCIVLNYYLVEGV